MRWLTSLSIVWIALNFMKHQSDQNYTVTQGKNGTTQHYMWPLMMAKKHVFLAHFWFFYHLLVLECSIISLQFKMYHTVFHSTTVSQMVKCKMIKPSQFSINYKLTIFMFILFKVWETSTDVHNSQITNFTLKKAWYRWC